MWIIELILLSLVLYSLWHFNFDALSEGMLTIAISLCVPVIASFTYKNKMSVATLLLSLAGFAISVYANTAFLFITGLAHFWLLIF